MQSEIKPSFKILATGLALITLSIVALVSSHSLTRRSSYIDYPCGVGHDPKITITSETKATYCISLITRDAVSGAGIYTWGSSKNEKFSLVAPSRIELPWWHGTLALEVDSPFLLVTTPKGVITRVLAPDDTYYRVRATQSLNPWLLMSAHFFITNDGVGDSVTAKPIKIKGIVIENWLPSPLGLLFYSLGLLLTLSEIGKTSLLMKLTRKIPLIISSLFSGSLQVVGWIGIGDAMIFIADYLTDPARDMRLVEGSTAEMHFINIALLISVSFLSVGFWISESVSHRSTTLGYALKFSSFLIAFFIWMYFLL